jgi:hypothetical protein
MTETLATLFRELLDGPPKDMCFVLNPGDAGLLRSLDGLSAAEASTIPPGHSSSVAAHVDHVRYGFSLLNRWRPDVNPFADADFSASWKRTTVNEQEWTTLRAELRRECEAWSRTLTMDLPDDEIIRLGVAGSVVHLAYHLGAIRQIDRSIRGPATD